MLEEDKSCIHDAFACSPSFYRYHHYHDGFYDSRPQVMNGI
jgi:hypothetical protein